MLPVGFKPHKISRRAALELSTTGSDITEVILLQINLNWKMLWTRNATRRGQGNEDLRKTTPSTYYDG
jgi:hypothetical protein